MPSANVRSKGHSSGRHSSNISCVLSTEKYLKGENKKYWGFQLEFRKKGGGCYIKAVSLFPYSHIKVKLAGEGSAPIKGAFSPKEGGGVEKRYGRAPFSLSSPSSKMQLRTLLHTSTLTSQHDPSRHPVKKQCACNKKRQYEIHWSIIGVGNQRIRA